VAAFQPTKVTTGCTPPATSCNNPAIFGTFGNVGKNVLRLPKTSNWDVQVSKYFNFTERWKLQLRAEYFNVLNHPNFAPESISTGVVNGTDQISAFDKINGNSAFGTFRAGKSAIRGLRSLRRKYSSDFSPQCKHPNRGVVLRRPIFVWAAAKRINIAVRVRENFQIVRR